MLLRHVHRKVSGTVGVAMWCVTQHVLFEEVPTLVLNPVATLTGNGVTRLTIGRIVSFHIPPNRFSLPTLCKYNSLDVWGFTPVTVKVTDNGLWRSEARLFIWNLFFVYCVISKLRQILTWSGGSLRRSYCQSLGKVRRKKRLLSCGFWRHVFWQVNVRTLQRTK
jgi:hypothetical protein